MTNLIRSSRRGHTINGKQFYSTQIMSEIIKETNEINRELGIKK